jgi:hypothetical protein
MEALFLFESSITTRSATQGHNPRYPNYFERFIFSFRLERTISWTYRGADKSLARPTSRCILFDGENISFDASLVIYK